MTKLTGISAANSTCAASSSGVAGTGAIQEGRVIGGKNSLSAGRAQSE